MSAREHDPLAAALDVAAGRRPAGADLDETRLLYARALREARRDVLAEPACPRAVVRRAQALFRPPVGVPLLALVFDSRRDAAPALRGGTVARSLRYESGAQALDVRIRRAAEGGVQVQLAVQPARPGLAASLSVAGAKRASRVDLDAQGSGETLLPAYARAMTVEVRAGRRSILRVDDVPLE